MKQFTVYEKILVAVFVTISLVVLWLLSPMSKVYLPADTTALEESLDFTLPDYLELKDTDKYHDVEVYHLFNNADQPHVITVIPFNDTPLTLEDIDFTEKLNPVLYLFWYHTGFIDKKLTDCQGEIIRNKNVIFCHFEGNKPGLNEITGKDGEVILFKRKGKTVFMAGIASEMAYNPDLVRKLLRDILK